MKYKISIFITALLMLAVSAQAQFSQFGAKAGLNLSNMTIDGSNDRNLRTGFHVGVFNRTGISEFFSIQPELLYTTKGFTNNYDVAVAEGDVNFNLNYLEIPINLVYHLAEDFSFQLGPYVSYLLSAKVDTNNELLGFFDFDTDSNIDRDNFKKFDFGVTAGLEFQLEPILLGFKYNLGLVNVAQDNLPEAFLGEKSKNTVIQIYAGILF